MEEFRESLTPIVDQPLVEIWWWRSGGVESARMKFLHI